MPKSMIKIRRKSDNKILNDKKYKVMTRKEFQTYQTLTENFSEYCKDIFSYIQKII